MFEQKVVALRFSGRGLKVFAADWPPRALLTPFLWWCGFAWHWVRVLSVFLYGTQGVSCRRFRVPAFSSVWFRVRPFFSSLPLLPPSSLGVGPGSSSFLLCVCRQDFDALGRRVRAAHAALFFLPLLSARAGSPLPFPSFSLSLFLSSLSLASMRVKQLGPQWKVQRDGDRLLVL